MEKRLTPYSFDAAVTPFAAAQSYPSLTSSPARTATTCQRFLPAPGMVIV